MNDDGLRAGVVPEKVKKKEKKEAPKEVVRSSASYCDYMETGLPNDNYYKYVRIRSGLMRRCLELSNDVFDNVVGWDSWGIKAKIAIALFKDAKFADNKV